MGDCRDVLSAVLSQVQGGGGVMSAPGATSKLAEVVAVQGGFVKQGLYLGVLVGLCVACTAAGALCYARKKRRQMQLAGVANGKYTPYGQAEDDDFGGVDAPRLASAVDEDDEPRGA